MYYYIHAASSFNRDIALIKLSKPVQLTDDVGVICLPTSDEQVKPNAICLSAGWGRVEEGE